MWESLGGGEDGVRRRTRGEEDRRTERWAGDCLGGAAHLRVSARDSVCAGGGRCLRKQGGRDGASRKVAVKPWLARRVTGSPVFSFSTI